MAMPPLPPIAIEQVIEQNLVKCGLSSKGISVAYQDELQSIEVVITPDSGATTESFKCVNDAVGLEIVTFTDTKLLMQFHKFKTDLYRPIMLEEARNSLDKLGLLENFPKRNSFSSDKMFAEGLELHCGLQKGEVFKENGDTISFQPFIPSPTNFSAFEKRYSCVLMAYTFAMANGDLNKIGFIGNEQVQTEDVSK
jgi:hypothetical protein